MTFECSTLILDLDGTISDPSLGITRCFNHALKSHGLDCLSEEQIAQEIGPPLDETFMKLAPDLDTTAIPALVSTYRERYSDVGYSENTLYPEIPEALKKLVAADIAMGVCTSKRKDFAVKILSMFGLLEFFKFVDGGDIGISKKMQLSGLLAAQEIDNCAIMVGDRSVDIISARTNGLRSIGVLWGFGSHAELSEASPSKILNQVRELPDSVIQQGR